MPSYTGRKTPIDFKYRAKYEIQTSILKSSEFGSGKTQITYENNLSHDLLKKYLHELIDLEFIELSKEGKKLYKTTELGLDYCRAFEPLKKALNGEFFESTVLDEKLRQNAISLLHNIGRNKNRYDTCALILGSTSEPKNSYKIYKDTGKPEYKNLLKYIDFLTKLTFLEKLEEDLFQRTSLGSKYYEAYLYFIHYLA